VGSFKLNGGIVAYKNTIVVTGHCKDGFHYFCIGESKGSKSDKVNFKCSCICHVKRGYLGEKEYGIRLQAEWDHRSWYEMMLEVYGERI